MDKNQSDADTMNRTIRQYHTLSIFDYICLILFIGLRNTSPAEDCLLPQRHPPRLVFPVFSSSGLSWCLLAAQRIIGTLSLW